MIIVHFLVFVKFMPASTDYTGWRLCFLVQSRQLDLTGLFASVIRLNWFFDITNRLARPVKSELNLRGSFTAMLVIDSRLIRSMLTASSRFHLWSRPVSIANADRAIGNPAGISQAAISVICSFPDHI